MSEFMPEIPYREKKEMPDIFGPEKKLNQIQKFQKNQM